MGIGRWRTWVVPVLVGVLAARCEGASVAAGPAPTAAAWSAGVWWNLDPQALSAPRGAGARHGGAEPELGPVLDAIAVRDLNAAVRETASLAADSSRDRSLRASALLARGLAWGATSDLLGAAEILAEGGDDQASVCNRMSLWENLGLSYSARAASARCARAEGRPRSFRAERWNGARVSAAALPAGEEASVLELLSAGAARAAQRRMLERGQAWRTFFEREAVRRWCAAADGRGRPAVEARLATLAGAYAAATTDAAPQRWLAELSALSPASVGSAKTALARWLAGATAAADFETEKAMASLRQAIGASARVAPALVLRMRAETARQLYSLGENTQLMATASQLRGDAVAAGDKWAAARALHLQTIAAIALGEWEIAIARADAAEPELEALGERTQAAYLGVLRAFALVALTEPDAAEEELVAAMRELAAVDETRYLAGAQTTYARLGRSFHRPFLAVAMQREALIHDRNDGNDGVVADSEGALAESLAAAGRREEAKTLIADAARRARRVASPAARTRTLALLAAVEAELYGDERPDLAVAKETEFLQAFTAFGEQYQRAEALLIRGQALRRLGRAAEAERDLDAAIDVQMVQGAEIQDPVRAANFLDRLRDEVEALVPVLLERGPDGAPALRLVERARALRDARMLGRRVPSGAAEVPRLAPGACATAYVALERELVAWTLCGEALHTARVAIGRREIGRRAQAFVAAARSGDGASLRAASESLSQALVAPQQALICAAADWSVSPDAVLAGAPLAWLACGSRYLFEERSVALVPTIHELEPRAETVAWQGFAIGDPYTPDAAGDVLPGAAREPAEVAAILPAEIATGRDATLERFKAAAATKSFLHYSGHYVTPRRRTDPLWLQFAPSAEAPDGRVPVRQIAALPLANVRLVFLSACSTSRSGESQLGASFGPTLAFLKAGVRDAVGDLWQVPDDDASAVTKLFYGHLRALGEPRAALRAVWKSEAQSSPRRRAALAALSLASTQSTGGMKR